MDVLVTRGLSKHYGRRVGVEELDLVLDEGTICGLLGPNGVGKTTAIRLFLGFLRPTRGSARIFGLDCWREGERARREVGYLPGDLRLYPWLTARRALALFGRVRQREVLAQGLELAEEFELDPDLRAGEMSRGMRQKLGLILALSPRPRLLILDEPTSSLDPVMQERLRRRLLALAAGGHTILFSSHVLGEVEQLCERVVILRGGRAVADAPLRDLRARAQRQVTLRWQAAAGSAELPAWLEVTERQGLVWRAAARGPVERLLGWLAAQPLENVAIGPPDLEALFREYYGKP